MSQSQAADGPSRILMLEDSDFDAELIQDQVLRVRPEPEVVRVIGRIGYVSALESGRYDVILSDFSLPDFDGMAALAVATEKAPDTPFIFVSGVLGEEIAIESFKKGATDYVLKQRLIRLPTAIERAISEARERSERRRAERQLQLLVAELSHRVKNTLATVLSIAHRTAKSSRTVEQYQEALTGRLHALAEGHALVFEANWGETSLHQVLERTLKAFRRDGDRSISLSGPKVILEPKAALALSLIFHELVTNAAKYGSLSSENGRIEASWTVSADADRARVALLWRESGGPPVEPPSHQGFGTTLVDRSARYELDGKAELDYRPTGLVCRIEFATGG